MAIESVYFNNLGIAFSSIAILLEIISCTFFKNHSKCLDYIQWGYFLAIITASSNYVPFSIELEVGSTLIDLPETTKFEICKIGAYTCNRAFALIFLVFISAFLVFMRIITLIGVVNEYGPKFEPIYRLFKGFLKWFYVPLLFQAIQGICNKEDVVASAVMLLVLILFPILQFTAYSFFDAPSEDPMIKWFELVNYGRAFLFALFGSLCMFFNSLVYLYFIFGIFMFSSIFYSYYFVNRERSGTIKKVGNVVYLAEEIMFLLLLTLYAGHSSWLTYAYLDIPAFSFIILSQIIHYCLEGSVLIEENLVKNKQSSSESNDAGLKCKKGETLAVVSVGNEKDLIDESLNKEKGEESSNIMLHNSTSSKVRRGNEVQ